VPTHSFQDIEYAAGDGVAVITMNRPKYRNAQSYRMLDEIDAAFGLARDDEAVRVVIVRGSDGVFSTGHDLGSPDAIAYREALGATTPIAQYNQTKRYNLDLLLEWRNFPKPTIAMVEGYCIWAGWMLAAAMDIVFAAEDALFLGGFNQYTTMPWDVGFRKAKEAAFESRYLTANEAEASGFVNRVVVPQDLESVTMDYARRIAENSAATLRMTKMQFNKAQDAQGFTQVVNDSFADYLAMVWMPGNSIMAESGKRVLAVDLAVRGRNGLRAGQTPPAAEH
jgi:enoyl-CoA hydratase